MNKTFHSLIEEVIEETNNSEYFDTVDRMMGTFRYILEKKLKQLLVMSSWDSVSVEDFCQFEIIHLDAEDLDRVSLKVRLYWDEKKGYLKDCGSFYYINCSGAIMENEELEDIDILEYVEHLYTKATINFERHTKTKTVDVRKDQVRELSNIASAITISGHIIGRSINPIRKYML